MSVGVVRDLTVSSKRTLVLLFATVQLEDEYWSSSQGLKNDTKATTRRVRKSNTMTTIYYIRKKKRNVRMKKRCVKHLKSNKEKS